MPTIQPVDPATVSGKSRQLLTALEQRMGRCTNMLRVMAHSAPVLDAYVHFNRAFEGMRMPAKLRGSLAMAIAQAMRCEYILSVAAALGVKEGLSVEELEAARHALSDDPKTSAALRFAVRVVEQRGEVDASEVEVLSASGYSDEEIIEIIATIALNLFRNYFNLVLRTDVDFPLVKVAEPLQ